MNEIEHSEEKQESNTTSKLKKIGLPILGLITTLLLLSGGFYGYTYASTPSHLRNPEFEHYHLRTQIIVDGEAVDFSKDEFQEEYDANSCSADITGQPVDFHDGQDQMAHVHWRGITGGEFLKFYGWNLIGGETDSLGRRYDQGLLREERIATAGNLLPELPDNKNFYVYVGDKNTYEQKNWENFLDKDLEDFMGKKSYLNPSEKTSFNPLDFLTVKVYAHGSAADEHTEPVEGEEEGDRLERINNLVGNVVIFVQSEAPSDEQVSDRFDNLSPLHDSVCGG